MGNRKYFFFSSLLADGMQKGTDLFKISVGVVSLIILIAWFGIMAGLFSDGLRWVGGYGEVSRGDLFAAIVVTVILLGLWIFGIVKSKQWFGRNR